MKRQGYVVAKIGVDKEVVPVTFIHGTREDAETVAAKMPSWYVLGGAGYADWRD